MKYVVIGVGPFSEPGNMGIFRTREAVEEFVKRDPFMLEGLVKDYSIRDNFVRDALGGVAIIASDTVVYVGRLG